MELFGNVMRESEIKSLATLVYYPQEKLHLIKKTEPDMPNWYRITLFRLIKLCKRASWKYTRSRVRKAIDDRFTYIMEELLHEDSEQRKPDYYNQIIDTIIEIGRADNYIVELSEVIRHLAIDRLHIIGDIFDRGPHSDKVMDELSRHHSIDIQWGNHDIVWMGAAAGSAACILNVIRVCARYANMHILEDYGINLIPLVTYALEYYTGGNFDEFKPELLGGKTISEKEEFLISQIHKAATILQFKIEAEIIKRHPEYMMDDRLLLDKIAFNEIDFPTVNPENPYELTEEESDIVDRLTASFQFSPRLQEHAAFLYSRGGMYTIYNGNLLFHGCVPMNGDGSYKHMKIDETDYSGRELLDAIERKVREGYLNYSDAVSRENGRDIMWYLWCGADSPLFGSDKMATFERYFYSDKSTHSEKRNPYYTFREKEDVCKKILHDFGLNPEIAHIINGHVPVKVIKGESPIKANGRLFVIDGGFAKAYQKSTGIAGYTLLYKAQGLVLVSHEPFESSQRAIEEELDIHSSEYVIEYMNERIKVRNTDDGALIMDNVKDLLDLMHAYETGKIKENR
jgi:fructose-1,6-bisphosphatase-3